MKKKLALFLSIALMLSAMSVPTYALPTIGEVNDAVAICTAINMVQGTGGGVTQAYLDSVPKRYQGAILLLRLLGKEVQALNYIYTTNFIDNEEFSWLEGRHILGYLYENRDVGFEGYADGTFKPFNEMTAKQYYKVMLVALGYEEYVDFEWNSTALLPGTLELAQSVGLTELQDDNDFRISDLCVATVEALRANRKGTSTTLAQHLVDMGKIDETVAISVGLIPPATVPDPVATPTAALTSVFPYEIALAIGDTQIQVTTVDGTFKSTLGDDNAETTALINGITGSANFGTQVSIDYTNITRTSSTTLVISIPKSTSYRISDDEMIGVVIPASCYNENVLAPVDAGQLRIEDSGSGTSTSPFAIVRPEDFEFISIAPASHYKQQRNLDFQGGTPYPVNDFDGVYDGDAKTISNFNLTAQNSNGTGLFNSVVQAWIKNVFIDNASLDANDYANTGILVGKSSSLIIDSSAINNSSITEAYYSGFFVGSNEGDLAITFGFAANNNVTSSKNGSRIGGLVGQSDITPSKSLSFNNCSVSNFTAETTGSLGGFVGSSWNTITIENSRANGLDLLGKQYVGGLVGFAMDNGGPTTITGNSTYGNITGAMDVGGIIGGCHAATITGNYSGISSYGIESANSSSVHRVLGSSFKPAQTTLDNTANENATLSASDILMFYINPFTSDANGLDGTSITPPFSFILLMPVLVKPFGYVDPWVASLQTTVDDLILPSFH